MIDLFTSPRFIITTAGVLLLVLGVLHLTNTRKMLSEFRFVLSAHRRIFQMAWIMQGTFYCVIGAFLALSGIALADKYTCIGFIARFFAAVLIFLALIIGATGSRSESTVIRVGPLILIVAGFALLVAAYSNN